MHPTYSLVAGGQAILCHICGKTSWHPENIAHLYCGVCRDFHLDETILDTLESVGVMHSVRQPHARPDAV